MPDTVHDAFEQLLGELAPTEAEVRQAESRLGAIEAALVPRLAPVRLERAGSLDHGTALRGQAYLDVLAILPSERLTIDSTAMLRAIADVLRGSLAAAEVTVAAPAARVRLGPQDGDACTIIPAELAGRNAQGAEIFLIPDRAGGWMRCCPGAYRDWLEEGDRRLGGRLKPFVRLMKAWSRSHGTGLRSMWIEARTAQWAADRSAFAYSDGVREVLRHMLEYAHAMPDPLDVGTPIEACALAAHSASFAAVARAAEIADEACAAEAAGRPAAALDHWRAVFNGHFPRFG